MSGQAAAISQGGTDRVGMPGRLFRAAVRLVVSLAIVGLVLTVPTVGVRSAEAAAVPTANTDSTAMSACAGQWSGYWTWKWNGKQWVATWTWVWVDCTGSYEVS